MSGYEKKPALYVGGGKVIEREGQEPYFRIELNLTELKAKLTPDLLRHWTSRNGQKNEVVNLIFAPLREATQYKTHSLKIDTYKPEKRTPADKYTRDTDTVDRVKAHFAPGHAKEEIIGNDEVPF